MSYELLVFDWDGTLIDSTARIISSFQGGARELGLRVPPHEDVKSIIGLGLKEAIVQVMPELNEADVDRLALVYSRHYVEVDKTPVALFDAVEEGLHELIGSGFRLAVATGKSRRGLDRALQESGLEHLFETTRCADETRSKPHPMMLNQILAQTGVSPRATVMIGDTDYDLNMARSAGVDALAVTYGAHPLERLQASEPTHQVDSFVEFMQWIKDHKRI